MTESTNGVVQVKEHAALYVTIALVLCISMQAALAATSMFHPAQQWDVVVNAQAAFKDATLILVGALTTLLKGS